MENVSLVSMITLVLMGYMMDCSFSENEMLSTSLTTDTNGSSHLAYSSFPTTTDNHPSSFTHATSSHSIDCEHAKQIYKNSISMDDLALTYFSTYGEGSDYYGNTKIIDWIQLDDVLCMEIKYKGGCVDPDISIFMGSQISMSYCPIYYLTVSQKISNADCGQKIVGTFYIELSELVYSIDTDFYLKYVGSLEYLVTKTNDEEKKIRITVE